MGSTACAWSGREPGTQSAQGDQPMEDSRQPASQPRARCIGSPVDNLLDDVRGAPDLGNIHSTEPVASRDIAGTGPAVAEMAGQSQGCTSQRKRNHQGRRNVDAAAAPGMAC